MNLALYSCLKDNLHESISRDLRTDVNLRKQAWDYFQMHSAQRLTTFNFYIVVSSVIATALFSSLQKDYRTPRLGVTLGSLLDVLSFVFWKLDVRNRDLIKRAESALRYFEATGDASEEPPHMAQIFLREDYDTGRMREKRSLLFWRNHYSYSDCFNLVFVAFALAGTIGALVSLAKNW
jgi:hypothetical protein